MGFLPPIRASSACCPRAPDHALLRDLRARAEHLRQVTAAAGATGHRDGHRRPGGNGRARALPGAAAPEDRLLLLELLSRWSRTPCLIFTRTKHRANRIMAATGHGRLHRRRAALQQVAEPAADGARQLPQRRLRSWSPPISPPAASTWPHLACHQLRCARLRGRLHPPHRPHRPRRSDGDALTFVTREDEPLIRNIERVLGANP